MRLSHTDNSRIRAVLTGLANNSRDAIEPFTAATAVQINRANFSPEVLRALDTVHASDEKCLRTSRRLAYRLSLPDEKYTGSVLLTIRKKEEYFYDDTNGWARNSHIKEFNPYKQALVDYAMRRLVLWKRAVTSERYVQYISSMASSPGQWVRMFPEVAQFLPDHLKEALRGAKRKSRLSQHFDPDHRINEHSLDEARAITMEVLATGLLVKKDDDDPVVVTFHAKG